MTPTRETILPHSPALAGRQRWHCLTRKVVTAWAPFYVAVDFDHEARPVKVQVSQPGKKMGTEFGAAIDCIGEACSQVMRGLIGSASQTFVNDRHETVQIDVAAAATRDQDGLIHGLNIAWEQRRGDPTVQAMLRQIESAITGLIAEARQA